MGQFGDILGSIGDIAGLFSSGGSDDDANQFYRRLASQMGEIDPTITGQQAVPSDQAASMDALRELQQTYRSGGLDQIGKGQIAEANAAAGQAAAANRNAVLGGMRSRGAGSSGVTGALQELGSQDANEGAALASSRAAADAGGRRMAAIGGAGEMGLRTAAAQDAINRFNAMMRQGAQQQTFGNRMGQLYGEGDLYGGAWKAGKAGEDRTSRLYSSVGNMLGSGMDQAKFAGLF